MSAGKDKIPARELAVLTLAQVRILLTKQRSFRFGELADLVGPQFKSGEEEERRLRYQVNKLCYRRMLQGADTGIYIPGTAFDAEMGEAALGRMEERVNSVFRKEGGVIEHSLLFDELAYSEGTERILRRLLLASPNYTKGLKISGWGQKWFLKEEMRDALPLPGRLHLLEVQIWRSRNRPSSGSDGLVGQLEAFRRRIGVCLREAREVTGKSSADVVADESVAQALKDCLLAAIGIAHGDAQAAQYGDIPSWWGKVLEAHEDESTALEAVWPGLESDGQTVPGLLQVTNVAYWEAVGANLGFDPALLSRGALRSVPQA